MAAVHDARPPLPALRIKSRWFRPGAGRTPAEQAGAMAFIVWRVSHQMLKRMRGADFDIDTGPAYFDFLLEVLVFMAQVTDRIAHARLPGDDRVAFTTALVRHLARTFDENLRELLGPPAAGEADGATRLIDAFNALAPDYAAFGAERELSTPEAGFHPDFAFVRYLGHRLEAGLPTKDRHWVIDQVQAVEAPEALAIVQRAMRDLYDASPRRARRTSPMGD